MRSVSGVRARMMFVVVSGLKWVMAINRGRCEQARVKDVWSELVMGMMPPTAQWQRSPRRVGQRGGVEAVGVPMILFLIETLRWDSCFRLGDISV